MTADDVQQGRDEARDTFDATRAQRRVTAFLMLLILLGVVGTTLTVLNGRNAMAASRADVQRNAELVQQLTMLTRQYEMQRVSDQQATEAFRADSRRLSIAICDQIEAVARQVGLTVPPCPRVPGG